MKFFIAVSALFALAASAPIEMTLQQIDAALQNPNLDQALRPALEAALDKIMNALWNGENLETVVVDLPDVFPGLIPEPAPLPVEPSPVPVPSPTEPAPAPAAGPLVQVIVNVNKQQQQVFEVPDASPEVAAKPEPSPANPIDVILN